MATAQSTSLLSGQITLYFFVSSTNLCGTAFVLIITLLLKVLFNGLVLFL